jgi:hypothetical protein
MGGMPVPNETRTLGFITRSSRPTALCAQLYSATSVRMSIDGLLLIKAPSTKFPSEKRIVKWTSSKENERPL